MQKLCLTEDTSNVEEASISSNELRKREKKTYKSPKICVIFF